MSRFLNLSGTFVPVREARETFGTINAANQEVVLDVSGDENVLVTHVPSAFVGTIEFTGAADNTGASYFPIAAYPYSPGSVGGTIPLAGQPMLLDALVAANTARQYVIPCGQLKKVRVRCSAYTSGSTVLSLRSDPQSSINTAIAAKPSTLLVTATAATGVTITATLPAVTGLRHIVDFIRVTRSATATLTAAATPVLVTTTNLPGGPVLTFGADAAVQGSDKEVVLDFGASGLAATALGTATTVVCPATTGVIWRVNVAYRLGL
jgi:hypothetical protein